MPDTTDKLKNYWENEGSSFSQFYKNFRIRSPKLLVSNFLQKRSNMLVGLTQVSYLGKVLDVGCGSGIYIKELLPRAKFINGIDISPKMIEKATQLLNRTKYNNWQLNVADAETLPFKKNNFDTVISIGLMDYMKSVSKVLLEFNRVLKYNGFLYVSIPKSPTIFFFLRSPLGNIIKKFIFDLPPIINIYDKQDIVDLLNKNNFKILEIKSVWTTMWLIKAVKK